MYLIGWMVHGLPERLFMGHRVVGALAPTGVFSSMEAEVPSMSIQELTSAEHRLSVISTCCVVIWLLVTSRNPCIVLHFRKTHKMSLCDMFFSALYGQYCGMDPKFIVM